MSGWALICSGVVFARSPRSPPFVFTMLENWVKVFTFYGKEEEWWLDVESYEWWAGPFEDDSVDWRTHHPTLWTVRYRHFGKWKYQYREEATSRPLSRRRMDRALDLIHAADGPVYHKK